jgi:calreticulin
MAVLERSSSPVAALIALASVAGVAGEVFFQEKFDGKHPDLTLSSWSLDLLSS